MGEMEWILLAAGPLFAVSGAIMLALQKRGNPIRSLVPRKPEDMLSAGRHHVDWNCFWNNPTVSDIRNGGSGVFGGIPDDLYSDPCDLP